MKLWMILLILWLAPALIAAPALMRLALHRPDHNAVDEKKPARKES